MARSKPTSIRWEQDWVDRIRELFPDDAYVAQSVRSILYPFLCGHVSFERDESGTVTRISGPNKQGRIVTICVDPSKPVQNIEPVSPPPKMGRPSP